MSIQPDAIAELRARFHHKVLSAKDEGYDAARTVFYGGIDRRPGAILRVADANDVCRAVSWAREHRGAMGSLGNV